MRICVHSTKSVEHSHCMQHQVNTQACMQHQVITPPCCRYMAYDTLSAEVKARIRGLEAAHVYTNRRRKDEKGRPVGMTDAQIAAATEVVGERVSVAPVLPFS
jgi:hypothetical protein